MSDLQLLFLVLALLYGWECACWVGRGSVAIRSWLGRRWRITHPGTLLGNQRGGFVFAHPLPPLGTLLTAAPFPLALSPEAALADAASSVNPGDRPAQRGRCIRWDEIDTVEAGGKKILVNGELLLKAGSPILAAQIAQRLREMRQVKAAGREAMILRALRECFDLSRLERRWQEFQEQTRTVRRVTNALFAYLFVLSPAVIWRLGFRPSWLALLAGMLALTSTIAILFHRAHKKLYPAAEDERFTHFLIILLSPATAIRACDVLSRPLLEACHPLTFARHFCSTPQFRELAREFLRGSRYPAVKQCPRPEPLAEETERYWRLALHETLEDFLKGNGLDPGQLLQAPAPADKTCLAYCPRCLAQFTTREGTCEDCGGLALLPLPGAAS